MTADQRDRHFRRNGVVVVVLERSPRQALPSPDPGSPTRRFARYLAIGPSLGPPPASIAAAGRLRQYALQTEPHFLSGGRPAFVLGRATAACRATTSAHLRGGAARGNASRSPAGVASACSAAVSAWHRGGVSSRVNFPACVFRTPRSDGSSTSATRRWSIEKKRATFDAIAGGGASAGSMSFARWRVVRSRRRSPV